jgi:hypothetical protein
MSLKEQCYGEKWNPFSVAYNGFTLSGLILPTVPFFETVFPAKRVLKLRTEILELPGRNEH